MTRSQRQYRGEVARVLGARVREMRKARGLSQADLADAAEMHRPNVARLEIGTNLPTLDTIALVAAALGVAPSELLEVIDGVRYA